MSKSIKIFTSVLFILQLIILYPHVTFAGKSWERSDLVGMRMSYDSASDIEEFNFTENSVTCTMGNKQALAGCLGNWNIESSGTLTIEGCCAEKITLSIGRLTGGATDDPCATRTYEVIRDGEPRLYKIMNVRACRAYANKMLTIYVLISILVIAIVIFLIVRKIRAKKKLKEEGFKEEATETGGRGKIILGAAAVAVILIVIFFVFFKGRDGDDKSTGRMTAQSVPAQKASAKEKHIIADQNVLVRDGSMRIVTGTVTHVSDGDTFHVTTDDKTKLRVRMFGIDAPETPKINQHTGKVDKPGQSYGEESWKALENKILGKQVRLDIINIDRYKRVVCLVFIGERNINLEMIREGYADLGEEFGPTFLPAKQAAKSERKGIWSLPNYERPADFRKRMQLSNN